MKTFRFEQEQTIGRPIDEVFAFFSNAANLASITPGWLDFEILTPSPIEMAPGTTIDYRIRVHGIPMRWRSEITVWEPPFRFVDEQRRGPYRQWIHEHAFEDLGDATRVRDRVRYQVLGGALVNRLFITRDVRRIFSYRADKLEEILHTRGVS
jgi:ligand-binding SRPBCC domain-containing protein